MLGRPHSLSKIDKPERESLPSREIIEPYDYGVMTPRQPF
jgi:hypothetical protein